MLDVHGSVTSITPLTGSIYGGTLVTIQGENFGSEITDNPVMIGGDYCYVQTTNATTITCRTLLFTSPKAVIDELIIVFLKASEEARTPNGNADILFSYIQPTTSVDLLSVAYDEATSTHQVSINGTGIDSTIQLFIDGY